LFGPNGPHFRQGIAFDHWARIKPPMRGRANTGMRGIFAKSARHDCSNNWTEYLFRFKESA
jgi:hypothetical protein